MFLRIVKAFFIILLMLIVVAIVAVNARLYAWTDVVDDLKELKFELNNGADDDMQDMYPEGYIFMNATYALAWSSFIKYNPEYRDEGVSEIDKAWTKINEDRSIPEGAFYNGWNSYILGSTPNRDVDLFKTQCDSIASSLQRTTFPESYAGGAWPADATVCVASLALHDRLFEPKYQDVVKKWIGEVKTQLDDRGMIPHSLHESARGSSMALMLIFLKDIDKDFANDQFIRFKENFVDSTIGITGIREYRKGESGGGDIDSGPVIFGYGGASTIVGMQTLAMYGEVKLGAKIRRAVDAMLPHRLLPIADSFRAWSHSNMPVDEPEASFTKFHLYSAALGILLILLILKLR